MGDTFDSRKGVDFSSLAWAKDNYYDRLGIMGVHVHTVVGNHTAYYKNTNDLNSLKELLGYYMNDVHIIMEPTVMEYGSLKMAMIPWINPENYESTLKFIKECKADWCGAHLELTGFDMMKGVKNTHGMDHKLFEKFELVLTGHFHVGSRRDNVWYLGSQMEFFWSDAHDPKYFHIVDTETREIQRIHNPYTLFEKIVYNDEEMDYNTYDLSNIDKKFVKVVVVNKKDSFLFDRFIDRIQSHDIHELKIAENFNEFLGENVEDEEIKFDDTEAIVNTYIDAVDTDLDKDKIKNQVRELMVEAQALEIA